MGEGRGRWVVQGRGAQAAGKPPTHPPSQTTLQSASAPMGGERHAAQKQLNTTPVHTCPHLPTPHLAEELLLQEFHPPAWGGWLVVGLSRGAGAKKYVVRSWGDGGPVDTVHASFLRAAILGGRGHEPLFLRAAILKMPHYSTIYQKRRPT